MARRRSLGGYNLQRGYFSSGGGSIAGLISRMVRSRRSYEDADMAEKYADGELSSKAYTRFLRKRMKGTVRKSTDRIKYENRVEGVEKDVFEEDFNRSVSLLRNQVQTAAANEDWASYREINSQLAGYYKDYANWVRNNRLPGTVEGSPVRDRYEDTIAAYEEEARTAEANIGRSERIEADKWKDTGASALLDQYGYSKSVYGNVLGALQRGADFALDDMGLPVAPTAGQEAIPASDAKERYAIMADITRQQIAEAQKAFQYYSNKGDQSQAVKVRDYLYELSQVLTNSEAKSKKNAVYTRDKDGLEDYLTPEEFQAMKTQGAKYEWVIDPTTGSVSQQGYSLENVNFEQDWAEINGKFYERQFDAEGKPVITDVEGKNYYFDESDRQWKDFGTQAPVGGQPEPQREGFAEQGVLKGAADIGERMADPLGKAEQFTKEKILPGVKEAGKEALWGLTGPVGAARGLYQSAKKGIGFIKDFEPTAFGTKAKSFLGKITDPIRGFFGAKSARATAERESQAMIKVRQQREERQRVRREERIGQEALKKGRLPTVPKLGQYIPPTRGALKLVDLLGQIKFGETSGRVRRAQDLLKNINIFPRSTPSTGYFGPITKRAVDKYWKIPKITPVRPRRRPGLGGGGGRSW